MRFEKIGPSSQNPNATTFPGESRRTGRGRSLSGSGAAEFEKKKAVSSAAEGRSYAFSATDLSVPSVRASGG